MGFHGFGLPPKPHFAANDKPQRVEQATSAGNGNPSRNKPSLRKAAYLLAGAAAQFALSACSTAPVVPNAPAVASSELAENQADAPVQLTEQDKKRFQTIEAEYQRLQQLPPDSEAREKGVEQLKTEWHKLRTEAVKGNAAAKAVLMALWVNRMHEEVIRPHPGLIRFYDSWHDGLLKSLAEKKLSPQEFRSAMQLRGMAGLSAYHGTTDPDRKNSLAISMSELFEPLMQLLQGKNSRALYSMGIQLLSDGFRDFTPMQQQQYLSHLKATFLESEKPARKYQAMIYLAIAYRESPKSPLWDGLLETVRQKLQNAEKADEQKYWIVFLGLLEAPDLPKLLHSMVKPGTPVNTQRAVAWALGRSRSPEALDMLEKILADRKFHPLAQEMAMYSLAEFHETAPERVMKTIQQYAPEPGQPAMGVKHCTEVEEAARAMREKLDARPKTELDYYVNKLLATDAERIAYRDLRNRYVQGWDLLDTAQKNKVDRSLIPFRQYLPEVLRKGGRHVFVKHSITEAKGYQNVVGFRTRDGRLNDSIQGVSSPEGEAVTSLDRLQPEHENVFAHELTHHLMQLVWGAQGHDVEIFSLYSQKHFIDNYGSTNMGEYGAESGEALDSLYKAHHLLYDALFENGYGNGLDNNRSKLKRVDPKMFDYLKGFRSIPLEIAQQMTDWYRNVPNAGWGLHGKETGSPFVDRA